MNEMVLYYTPVPQPHTAKLKSVLVRMGVRIRNVAPEQTGNLVGVLAGLPGFAANETAEAKTDTAETAAAETDAAAPAIAHEMLVMKNFSSRRIDELLINLRKAGVPKIALKAVITEDNSRWTFYQLYEELVQEHEAMSGENINKTEEV